MLVIRQSDCIDCGVCEPECPVEAIVPDGPNITDHREPPTDADEFKTIPNKYPKFFSPLPGD